MIFPKKEGVKESESNEASFPKRNESIVIDTKEVFPWDIIRIVQQGGTLVFDRNFFAIAASSLSPSY